ncbi:MAG: murein L,D-transpeptidase [Actinobacteria bacterium]|nr:murein L,D-transpeptidase [Actinomycetota bacterium]
MTTPTRTRTAVLAALAAAALVTTSCSGSAGGASSDTTVAPDTAPVTSTTEAPTTTAAPTTTSTTSTTVPPDPTQQTEPDGALQAGSKGVRTRAVQQALKDQHYDPGEVDGKFGRQVTMAVWAFQALHGLPKDGIVTPELETLILSKPAQEMLRPELGPTHTEVDLTRQVLIVWRDGAPTLITHVSSGSQVPYCEETDQGQNCGNAVTPLGVYHYQRRIEGWREAPLGRLYNPVYFNGGIAVHGAPSVPDHPASHGCVRIPMHIAEYFPSLVANGETIEVYRS